MESEAEIVLESTPEPDIETAGEEAARRESGAHADPDTLPDVDGKLFRGRWRQNCRLVLDER